jgi:hypothetical protein
MGMFNKDEVATLAKMEATLQTEMRLLREAYDKQQATIQTMNKHIKFLVHIVKLANPELDENDLPPLTTQKR